jgi:hypothetical protein
VAASRINLVHPWFEVMGNVSAIVCGGSSMVSMVEHADNLFSGPDNA